MKTLQNESTNKVTIIGKLIDKTFTPRKTKDNRDAESAQITLRVTQTYGGKEETSEIKVYFFATAFTNKGGPNPAYATIQSLKTFKSVQDVGLDEADTIRITGGRVEESVYVSNAGNLVDSHRISGSFASTTSMSESASFIIDIFILDMHPEEDRDGDPTGRLVVRGAIVKYNGTIDIIDFIVEDPNNVDYIERNWETNQTVTIKGRVRALTKEEKNSGKESSWGEDIPESTTSFINELIITKGDDEGKEDEFAYDPAEIKKAFNVRKAMIEQLQIDAKQKSTKSAATATPTAEKPQYNWQ